MNRARLNEPCRCVVKSVRLSAGLREASGLEQCVPNCILIPYRNTINTWKVLCGVFLFYHHHHNIKD